MIIGVYQNSYLKYVLQIKCSHFVIVDCIEKSKSMNMNVFFLFLQNTGAKHKTLSAFLNRAIETLHIRTTKNTKKSVKYQTNFK